jgi:hypothetical protein
MGKYEPLGRYLSESREGFKTMSFSEIEKILGFSLPMSANVHRPWWANDETHVQAFDGWLSIGWKVESVNLTTQYVTFRKSLQNETKRTSAS